MTSTRHAVLGVSVPGTLSSSLPLRFQGQNSGSVPCALQTCRAGLRAECGFATATLGIDDSVSRESVRISPRRHHAQGSCNRVLISMNTPVCCQCWAAGSLRNHSFDPLTSRVTELAAKGPTVNTLCFQATWRVLRLPRPPCSESPRAPPGPE